MLLGTIKARTLLPRASHACLQTYYTYLFKLSHRRVLVRFGLRSCGYVYRHTHTHLRQMLIKNANRLHFESDVVGHLDLDSSVKVSVSPTKARLFYQVYHCLPLCQSTARKRRHTHSLTLALSLSLSHTHTHVRSVTQQTPSSIPSLVSVYVCIYGMPGAEVKSSILSSMQNLIYFIFRSLQKLATSMSSNGNDAG